MRFPFTKIHFCDALVFMCMDFRFWELSAKFLKKQGIQSFDIVTFPGAAKMIAENNSQCPALLSSSISSKLHNCKKFIIINHADCGAYGGREAFSNPAQEKKHHFKDLKNSIKILKSKYPDKKVFGIYADLDKKMQRVNFIKIYKQ